MDGGTLTERAAGTIDLEEALWIGRSIAEAIRYAHRHGVAHLDLKPENILFRETGPDTWAVPKVSDWGLAKFLLEHSKSVEGLSIGYAAPEQFDPDRYGSPDDYTDIYQLGVLIYELITGSPPFTGQQAAVIRATLDEAPPPPTEVNPALPPEVDTILLTALAKNKAYRYESVLDFRRALDDLFEALVSGQAEPATDRKPDKTAQDVAKTDVSIESKYWIWHFYFVVLWPLVLGILVTEAGLRALGFGEDIMFLPLIGVILLGFVAGFGSLLGYHVEAKRLKAVQADYIPRRWVYTVAHILTTPVIVAPIYLFQRWRHVGIPWNDLRLWE